MRFIDVKLQCGWSGCAIAAPESDGLVFTRTITLDGRKTREIDICKSHSDELDEILNPLLKDGRTVETSKKLPKAPKAPGTPTVDTDDDLVCKVPECDRHGRPAKSKVGLAQHVIRGHGYDNLIAYYEDYPPTNG